ncbi:MAG: branched-chain-amino-acid transaminase [Phycisphaerales bacterium]
MKTKAAPVKKPAPVAAAKNGVRKHVNGVSKPARASRTVALSDHSPAAHLAKAADWTKETKPIIYVNGKMVPKGEATISVYDHGLLYGDGCFEGIRIYKRKIFKCGQHMERLWRSAEALRLKIPITRDEMVQVMRDCINANGIVDGYIRLVVTRGYGSLGLNPFKCPVAGVICIADQISLYPPEVYQTGMKVIIAKRPRTPIACLDPRVKSLNYLNNILAKVEAIDAGCLEAIMLNLDGYVCECTGDNIFMINNGQVFTPPTEAGVLEGVTRRFVIDLMTAAGIRYTIRNIRPEELKGADEVFLTGTAAEIIAVQQIDDARIGPGGEGPVTKRLRDAFRKVVTSDHVPED